MKASLEPTQRTVRDFRMVDDAIKHGRIDLILTSHLKIRQNTVDSLTYIRELKEAGVEVYFEKKDFFTQNAQIAQQNA